MPILSRFKDTLGALLQAIKLVWGVQRGLALLVVMTTVLQGFIPAISAWIGKLIVDGVVQGLAHPIDAFSTLGPILLLAFLVVIVGQILDSVAQISQELLRDLLGQRISIMVIEKAISLDLSYYETPSYYDMLQRAQQEASYRPLAIAQQLLTVVRGSITGISLVYIIMQFSPWMALALILIAAPALFAQSLYGQAAFQLQRERVPEWRRLVYYGWLLTAKQFVKEIKVYGLASILLDRYRGLYRKFYRENRGLFIRRNLAGLFLQIIAVAGHYGMYYLIVIQTINGNITLGAMTMYAGALLQAQTVASNLMYSIAALYEHNLFLSNLFSFLNLKPHLPKIENAKPAPKVDQTCIQVENLSFQYPGASGPVLQDICLNIQTGEKLAIVGENGSGKTTLVKLLLRLYDPTVGRIMLDGIDLREIDLESLHLRISVIFQDFVQYNATARENIGFGKIQHLDNIRQIEDAAKKSGAHDFLMTLPLDYETMLGRWFDDQGSDLSIGQWQRVALARAYMRDAPLLVLDEPTAALDAKAEYELFKHLKDLAARRTVILISHRFSTVRMADRIIVLENGRIIEQGCHDELVARRGVYAKMFELQAEGYR